MKEAFLGHPAYGNVSMNGVPYFTLAVSVCLPGSMHHSGHQPPHHRLHHDQNTSSKIERVCVAYNVDSSECECAPDLC